jgi:hypothetical protein
MGYFKFPRRLREALVVQQDTSDPVYGVDYGSRDGKDISTSIASLRQNDFSAAVRKSQRRVFELQKSVFRRIDVDLKQILTATV